MSSPPAARTLFAYLVVAAGLLGGVYQGWHAARRNRAAVTLNHLDTIYSFANNDDLLQSVEAQLQAGRARDEGLPGSSWLLLLAWRAQGHAEAEAIKPATLVRWGMRKLEAGERHNAAYLFRWATELDPGLGDAWYGLGRASAASGELVDAIAAYDRAAAATKWLDVRRGDVYLAQGDLFRSRERMEEAVSSYRQALESASFGDPQAAGAAYYGLGEIALWHDHDPGQALVDYRRALAVNPDDHWAKLRLGLALYRAHGDLAAAEQAIEMAISDWPGDSHLQWPYFYLAEIYEEAGLRKEAMAAYERVLSLDPSNQRAATKLDTLGSP